MWAWSPLDGDRPRVAAGAEHVEGLGAPWAEGEAVACDVRLDVRSADVGEATGIVGAEAA